MAPRTRYLHSGDVRIAYQVFGDGPVDLVFVPGLVSHVELMWDDPAYARFMRRLGQSCRVITYDRRGMGCSERLSMPSILEERAGDIAAVADAAEADRPIVLGFSDGGPDAVLFAATHPDRASGLILCCTAATGLADDEQPGFVHPDYWERMSYLIEHWGDGWNLNLYAPTLAAGPLHRRLIAAFERSAATSEILTRQLLANASLSVKQLLPSISLPTLVLSRSDDFVPVESGAYVAKNIRGARFEVISGTDHVPFAGNANAFLTRIEDFLHEVSGVNPPSDTRVESILFVGSLDAPGPRAMIRARELLSNVVSDQAGRVVQVGDESQIALFEGPAAAVRAARTYIDDAPFATRAGIHVGAVTTGADGVSGAAIHLAARVMQAASPRALLLSPAAADLLPRALFQLQDLEPRDLKGFEGTWTLSRVDGESRPEIVPTDLRRPSDRLLTWIGIRIPWQARALNRMLSATQAGRLPVGE